jgi:phosphoenolpyruvate carboxykinase (GTP)
MGPKKGVIDIVTELGGIRTADAADKLFEKRVPADQLAKLNRIKNEAVRLKIANAIVLCDPDSVFVDAGSDEDRQYIKELSIKKGEEKTLPMENHTIHFDLKRSIPWPRPWIAATLLKISSRK